MGLQNSPNRPAVATAPTGSKPNAPHTGTYGFKGGAAASGVGVANAVGKRAK